MIYAKVDVKLRDHERAHRAGVAMATWTWALLYVREQESDGFIPDISLRGSWAGEKEARRHAAKLVEVGLWEMAEGGGWQICRYSDKNTTRAQNDVARAEARARMDRVRANKQRTSSEPQKVLHTVVPGSSSGSSSGSSEVSDQDPDRIETAPTGIRLAIEPPAWFRQAAESAGMVVGEVTDIQARWVSYRSSRTRKGWSKNHEDAVGWLVDVMRSERERAKSGGGARGAGGGPRGDRQPHDTGWLSRIPKTGTEFDL